MTASDLHGVLIFESQHNQVCPLDCDGKVFIVLFSQSQISVTQPVIPELNKEVVHRLQTAVFILQGVCWTVVQLTDPSDALAPTLSPVAFQHTSKIPPVPR